MSFKLYATQCIIDQVWNTDLVNSSSRHKIMIQLKKILKFTKSS